MILISGATGLVGRHVLTALIKKGKSIRALFRSDEKRDSVINNLTHSLSISQHKTLEKVEWFKVDINDVPRLIHAFKNIEEVYHCAGLVSFDIRDKNKLRKINIEGTANMVNIALEAKVKKFCHLSSVAALGSELNGKPIHENSPRNNNNLHNYYEISKYGAELEVWRASQENLPVIIVNPAIIIGPGNWHSGSGQLFSRVDKGFPFRIPRKTGFIGVDDVVLGMIQLMESSIKNQRFILVSEIQSLSSVTDKIAVELNCKPPRYNLKKWMTYILWAAQTIGHTFFRSKKQLTRQGIDNMFGTVNYDNSKIQTQLEFKFTPIDQAIKKTAQRYLEEKAK